MKDRIALVADLLMGAAHADKTLHGHEASAVRQLLEELMDDEDLPADVDKRLSGFKAATFDLAKTAEAFKGDSVETKRRLLELVAAVHESDEELDIDEDEFLRKLGAALGVPASAFEDLTLDFEVDELREGLETIRRGG
jgi:uncharacterized tellurite resistance protein B-like protein